MKTQTALTLLLFLAACSSTQATEAETAQDMAEETQRQAQAASQPLGANDIVTVAMSTGVHDTLATALQAGGLVGVLKGPGPFTVFAPTDAAFAKLPAGTLDMLLLPENKSKLADVLKYHVVQGKVLSSQVAKLNSANTVAGKPVSVEVSGGNVVLDGNATVTQADVKASNGVIHVIDTVLLPE